MTDENQEMNDYVQSTLVGGEVQDTGTAVPADSLAQIIQEIIKIEPELRPFFGPEIRTGFMDESTYMIYTRLLMYAYHILIRGKMFGVRMTHVVKDILFGAKVMASASTSKGGKLLDTLISTRKEVKLETPKQQKGSFLRRNK